MIKSILIENFKGFKRLDLPQISRFTLIGGRNNIGKTSLLEAIFMFYDIGDPGLFIRPLSWRNVSATFGDADTLVAPVFHGFDMKRHVKITIYDSIYKGTMELAFNSSYSQKSINVELTKPTTTLPQVKTDQALSTSYAIDITYKIDGQKGQKISLVVKQSPGNLNIEFEPNPLPKVLPDDIMRGVIFIGLRMIINPLEDATRLSQLDIEKKTEQILEFLKILEPSVIGISSAILPQSAAIYVDTGMKRKVPIWYMGDGMNRLLSIILAIATAKNGIVLIDEIDTGLHYSVMAKVWEGICRAAQEFNCQVIATTHSYECLQAAHDGILQAKMDHEFCYIRLDSLNEDIVANTYSHDVLGAALQNGWEVR